jgi:TRAP-type C4-dicarboxylate transport system substrate-binding protein
MTKRGPVRRPADLGGMKIRVMDSRALREAVDRLGASATPMSQGEVYSALDRGVIDGWENNPPTCLTFSMHETGCKYFAWTRHVAIPDLLILNPDWIAALDPDLRAVLDEALAALEREQRELWRREERAAVEQLAAGGMLFNEVDAEAFRAPFADFYAGYVAEYGEDFGRLLETIRSSGDGR